MDENYPRTTNYYVVIGIIFGALVLSVVFLHESKQVAVGEEAERTKRDPAEVDHIYNFVCVYIYLYVCTHVGIYVCMLINVDVYISIYMCTYLHIICVNICMYIHVYIYMYVYIHIRIYI